MRHETVKPSHPGAVLRDIVVPELPFGKAELARRLKISRQHLYDILNERQPVSPETAVKLGKLFGNGPGIWSRLQAAHDLWEAERTVDVSDIETVDGPARG